MFKFVAWPLAQRVTCDNIFHGFFHAAISFEQCIGIACTIYAVERMKDDRPLRDVDGGEAWVHISKQWRPVLKLSRSAAERRSGSFLEAGAALRDFYAGRRRSASPSAF